MHTFSKSLHQFGLAYSPAHARYPAQLAERFAAHQRLYSLHLPCLLPLPFAGQESLPTLQVTLALAQQLLLLYVLVHQGLHQMGHTHVKHVPAHHSCVMLKALQMLTAMQTRGVPGA